MGDRGERTAELVAAELIDALTNVVSSLGLHDRSDSSPDGSDPVSDIAPQRGRLLLVAPSSPG